jgi:hypothetical protein
VCPNPFRAHIPIVGPILSAPTAWVRRVLSGRVLFSGGWFVMVGAPI